MYGWLLKPGTERDESGTSRPVPPTNISTLQAALRPSGLKFYDVMIVPILCYGCELWGFHEDKDLERVEDHYLKFVLYLPPNATTAAIRGELGQLPIHLLWKERILRYWNRLCSEDAPVLLRHAILQSKALT